jgi:parallel beta-helix repeat protein/YD repeat-containing protein
MRASASVLSVSALVFVFALFVRAGQESPQRTTDQSALTSTQAYDSDGRSVSITDSRGKTTHPVQNPAIDASEEIGSQALDVSPSAISAAITIHVPADQPTIQAAINAANSGDTVLVADGTYKENINFNGKAITVTSVHGASKTSIDGGGVNTVVLFVTNETATSVLNGFTITNGSAGFQAPNFGEGGGISVSGSSPTITNNVIRANTACNGAGIGVGFGGPLIQKNVISNNVQGGCSGGIGGGGISVRGASSNTRIIGNVIASNSMPSGGGGISLFAAGAPIIRNNIIQGNDGGGSGGGLVMFNDASPQIVQNLFFHNIASQGGAIFWLIPVSTPGILLLNNTIAENSSSSGSAIFDGGFDTNMTIENNLVIGKAGQSAYFCQQFNGNTTPAVFAHNDVFAEGAAAISGNCTVTTGTNGNISAAPSFVSSLANNFHLQAGSPAIDTGTSSASLPAKDLDGFPRIENGIVDIGAYEFFLTGISLQPSSLTFSTQLIGTKSTAQPVVVMNTGTMPLFLGVSITGDFLQSNNCPSRVAPGAKCTVNVSFKPTGVGARTGGLLFADNASSSPQNVFLTGTGQGFPIVSLSTTSLAFGVKVLGSTSASKNVVLRNTGTTTLAISSIVASGDFIIPANSCGSSLAPQTSCTISVAFKPTAVGARIGTLSINDNASGSPHTVSLSGTGTAVTLSSSALNFSPQLVSTTSVGRTVTVTNHSTTTLNFTGITIAGANAGDFIIASKTCGSSLAGNTTCTVTVKFRPSLIGPESATLSFFDDGGASPQIVHMAGTGTVVTLSSSSITFPPQSTGTISAPQSVTLTNHAATTLHINSVSIAGTNAGDFLISFDSCPPDLIANAGCTVSVEFQPTAIGTRTASLAFSDNGGASPQLVKLAGTGQ